MRFEKLDKYLLWSVCITVLSVISINFVTSYQHIYTLGLRYGEYGVDARLMPVGIDGMLLTLSIANIFAARFERDRKHWFLRAALGCGVFGTVMANGAYGANWGITGGLLATWSPVALFISVEAGLYAFRVVAKVLAAQAPAGAEAGKRRRGRPPGSRNTPKAPVEPLAGADVEMPALTGTITPPDPFRDLRAVV